MKTIVLVFATLVLAVSSTPTNGFGQCQREVLWARKASDPLSDFTVLLYRSLSNGNSNKNIVFSPVSIALSLAQLQAGSDGDTRAQMRYVLVKRGSNDSDAISIYQALQHQLLLSSESEPGVTLNLINGIYQSPRINLKEEYVTTIRECFGNDIQTCDFQKNAKECRRTINEWVANNTANKIPKLFSDASIKPDALAVLANAIYFKAPWNKRFPSPLISTSEFYQFGRDEDEQSVQYMTNEDQYLYSQTTAVSIVGIPYKGYEFYMYIILPKKRDGLYEFEKTFTGTELMYLINRTVEREVEVRIPKFKIKTRTNLKPVLTSLGLKDMFGDAANFSRMTDSKMFVNAASHEAFITVNEKGTEAAAATGFSMELLSARPIPIPFVADHPFLWAIVHQPTHAIVFAGKVLYVE